jgi:Xaa-Pro aminopeptidase
VHQATIASITGSGYVMGLPPADADDGFISMRHGTGHGIGLDVHEPILLSDGGGEIMANEVFTVEPGLYSARFGGVRVEDMIVVTTAGPKNLNCLPDHLDWR